MRARWRRAPAPIGGNVKAEAESASTTRRSPGFCGVQTPTRPPAISCWPRCTIFIPTATLMELAFRNDRFEIDELHLMKATQCRPMVSEAGDLFYYLGGNEVVARMVGEHNIVVPARDVLHIKLTPSRRALPIRWSAKSPLIAAALDMATSGAISQQTLNFVIEPGAAERSALDRSHA